MTSPCIETYIKRKDAELYEVLEDLCMGGLKPRFGRGVTVLLPTGTFRDNIIKLAESDPEEAIKNFMACVLNDCYPTLGDLHKAKSTGISNRINQEIDITITGNEGKLSNDSLVKKSDFKPISTRSNLMVYILDGPMPTNGKPSKFVSVDKGKGKGKGKSEVGGGFEVSTSRYIFAKRVEEDYCLYKGATEGSQKLSRNPYADAVGSLITFLECNKERYSKEYARVHCTIDHNPITSFYILFEPYCTKDAELLLSKDFFEDYVKSSINVNTYTTITEFINEHDNKDHVNAVNTVRTSVTIAGNITAPMQAIQENYGKLCATGKVGTDQVLCAESISYYKDRCSKRQAQDEFRIFVYNNMELFSSSHLDLAEFKDFVNICCTKLNFNNCDSQVMFNNAKLLKTIKPKEVFYSGPYQFIRSTNFLYMPYTDKEIGEIGGTDDTDNPTDTTIINCANVNSQYLRENTPHDNNTGEIESCISKLLTFISSSPEQFEGLKTTFDGLRTELNK